MENDAFDCTWRHTKTGLRVRVRGTDLFVDADCAEDARYALAALIEERLNVIDPVLNFVNGVPDEVLPAEYTSAGFVAVSGSKAVPLSVDRQELYSGGFCDFCARPVGERTAAVLELEMAGCSHDVLQASRFGSIFSQTFLEGVLPERGGFETRKVAFKSRSKKDYFELIPRTQPIDTVAAADVLAELVALHCSACGSREVSYLTDHGYIYVVSQEAVDSATPHFFAGQGRRLCLRRRALLELADRYGLTGIIRSQVGVAPGQRLLEVGSKDMVLLKAEAMPKRRLP